MGNERSLRHQKFDDVETRNLAYNIFVLLITFLALFSMVGYYFFPLPPQVKQVLLISDILACILLMFDFFLTWYNAPDRRFYLLRYGWLDFLGSIPGLLIFRLLRIFRLARIFRRMRRTTSEEVRQQVRQRLGESTLMIAILMIYLVVMLGSIAIVQVESPAPNANIKTGGDAVWWSFVTIATVGYGDRFPVTTAGRSIAILVMVVGVSVFSVLTGFLALSFQSRRAKQQEDAIEVLRSELSEIRSLLEQDRALRSLEDTRDRIEKDRQE
jgi:voltage-gated potassium channel